MGINRYEDYGRRHGVKELSINNKVSTDSYRSSIAMSSISDLQNENVLLRNKLEKAERIIKSNNDGVRWLFRCVGFVWLLTILAYATAVGLIKFNSFIFPKDDKCQETK